ncbi:MAG: thiamine pyrophosphate-binding protein, partial [Dehalococcoidia bacterium]|nr:thiamine pyrophosphate-binding protein [Dehalococcoidia bacterium]
MERAADLLLSGKRVAILVGNGAQRSGATQELLKLAETLGTPVFTTPAGKGIISDDNPLCMGVYTRPLGSSSSGDEPVQAFLDTLDTVLVVGSSLPHSRTRALGLRLPSNLIHVDIDAESIGKVYDTAVGVVGDARV